MLLKFLSKYKLQFFLPAVICLLLSYVWGNLRSAQEDLQLAAKNASTTVTDLQNHLGHLFSDSLAMKIAVNGNVSQEEMHDYAALPFSMLAYKKDSLVFWNNNSVIPTQYVSSFAEGISFQKFKNGFYLVIRKPFANISREGEVNLLALIPVKFDYVTVNTYLQPHFSGLFHLPDYFNVAAEKEDGMMPVSDGNDHALFFIGLDEDERKASTNVFAVVLFCIGFLFFLFSLSVLMDRLPAQRWLWIRPLILLLLFFVVAEFFALKTLLPHAVQNWKLFDPNLFASGGFANSLGSLLFDLLFVLWASLYLTNKFPVHLALPHHSVKNYVALAIGYLLIFFFSFYSVGLIRSLVFDSKIFFGYFNPYYPDPISITAVFCIGIMFCCLFLLSRKILSVLEFTSVHTFDRLLVLLICSVISIFFYLRFDSDFSAPWLLLWFSAFILLLPYFRFDRFTEFSFVKLFLLLVFFCASGAALLNVYGDEKERDVRISYARKLIADRDVVTEFLLTDLDTKISRDNFLIDYFRSPQLGSKALKDRLQQLYFDQGFSRYKISFYPFDSAGVYQPLTTDDAAFISEKKLEADKELIDQGNIYYEFNTSGNITYLAVYTVKDHAATVGKLFVSLSADAYNEAGVYPELLLEEKDKPPSGTEKYSHAIYHHDHLVDQHGSYPYDFHFDMQHDRGKETQYVNLKGSSHLIYSPGNEMIVVVSREDDWLSSFISYFSFLFLVMFVVALFVLPFNQLIHTSTWSGWRDMLDTASLRAMIHTFFMVFIFALVILIGYITSQFFVRQFNEITQTQVETQLNEVLEEVQAIYKAHQSAYLPKEDFFVALKRQASQLADIEDIDVNFFDDHGNLISTSQPTVFEKGLTSKKIHPIPFLSLSKENQTMLVQTEQIGSLLFYSGYEAVRDERGKLIVFFQLPYYNSRENLNNQVGFFFATLINILVFATILAGLLTPFISSRITRRLSTLAAAFKDVDLKKKNQEISWSGNDEIKPLVDEYNKKIAELQISAELLERNASELAWREMAKQVAHEIKNPLTPMKLSIQHLQRAQENDSANVRELTKKVLQTLMEQIEKLSHIASSFSNFARMPEPDMQIVQLNGILESSRKLHEQNENVVISFSEKSENDVVMGDKNQLLQVFDNLLLNAIQAIPEDRLGRIEVITRSVNGQLIISITDNGIGISDDTAGKVFAPNFTTKTSGTGLGLAFCKRSIEAQRGTITFHSEPGEGTTFVIHMPLKTPE